MQKPKIIFRKCKYSDIDDLADLYIEVYKYTNPIEKWNKESATNFINYFYENCKNLFFVLEIEKELIGGIWAQVKPWWNGNRIYNIELFIKREFQGKGISKIALTKFFTDAVAEYNVVTVEAITFNDRKFPLDYYDRLGLKKDSQLILLNGEISTILDNLTN